jgi:PAS domain S-box-containing protein
MSVTVLAVGIPEKDYQALIQSCCFDTLVRAQDTVSALEILATTSTIFLVLIDVTEMGEHALALVKQLHDSDQFSHIRTLLLTDTQDLAYEIMGLKLGASDYLRKPLNPLSLEARILMHQELHQQHKLNQLMTKQQMITYEIFSQAPVGIVILHDNDNRKVYGNVNPAFERLTGYRADQLVNLDWTDITHPDDIAREQQLFEQLQSGEISSYNLEKRYLHPDNSVTWVYSVVTYLATNEHAERTIVCIVQDITKRKELAQSLAESERSKSVLLSHLPGMAYRCNYDRQWTMQFVSDGCQYLTGYAPADLIQNNTLSYNDVIAPEYRKPIWDSWNTLLDDHRIFKQEYEIVTKTGERKWVLEVGQGVYTSSGTVQAIEGIILDISERKQMEQELTYTSEHDMWTGLHNRRYLERLLEQELQKKYPERRALIAIDISMIQSLSAAYGFQYTRDVIKKVASALQVYTSDQCLLFNTYEHRFVFYYTGYSDIGEIENFCTKLSLTLAPLLSMERIGWGIGVVEIDQGYHQSLDQVVTHLQLAAENSLATFEHNFSVCFFNSELLKFMEREKVIQQDMHHIIEGKHPEKLFLLYQPIIDIKTGKIYAFEALSRLSSTHLGTVSPLEFIALAEKTRLIVPLGDEIIRRALLFLRTLHDAGHTTISVSINISPFQLLKKEFYDVFWHLVQVTAVDPAHIILEITESVFTSKFQEVNTLLNSLKHLGIQIALDDFGTGYSSYARERDMNIDCLKIDKSFIDRLMMLSEDEAITGDIISMSHRLGHVVVAEGVEYEQQRAYLEHHGCDYLQGYLVSKPIDENQALLLCRQQRS